MTQNNLINTCLNLIRTNKTYPINNIYLLGDINKIVIENNNNLLSSDDFKMLLDNNNNDDMYINGLNALSNILIYKSEQYRDVIKKYKINKNVSYFNSTINFLKNIVHKMENLEKSNNSSENNSVSSNDSSKYNFPIDFFLRPKSINQSSGTSENQSSRTPRIQLDELFENQSSRTSENQLSRTSENQLDELLEYQSRIAVCLSSEDIKKLKEVRIKRKKSNEPESLSDIENYLFPYFETTPTLSIENPLKPLRKLSMDEYIDSLNIYKL